MSVQTLSSNGEMNCQGVLAGNLNNTPPLVGFPISSTGTSQGMYQHLGIAGDGTLITNFLNASSNKLGGFAFYTSNSTTAPKKLLNMDLNGIGTEKDFSVSNVSSGGNYTNVMSPNVSTIRNLGTADGNVIRPTLIQINNDATHANILLQNQDYPYNQITDISANVSKLTSTDLLFNGVSTNTKISTNTSNIATNTTSINNINSQLPQIVVPTLTFSSPAIYADSSIIPSTNTTYQNTYGVFGWYMKNVNIGSKFNLYFPPQPNMKVSDLKGVYYEMFSNCANLGDMPYVTIYTKPTGNSDYRPWYHSSYTVVPSVLPSANSLVQCFGNLQNLGFNSANVWGNYSNSPLIASTYQNPKGDYQPTQEILFVSLSSNSASAINNLDCSLLKFGMISTFSNEFLLM